ncbi:CBS domain-containing protein [Patescibacteria group bacterium]|nr:CBS domain-containing protein [Patescibacteria group bacterium]MBU1448797.1 CBS domain-containing protein [Patescibacteria group bacterium]MBU2613599.1 CBS domain-containing protein [Patescibacteria group bacterium]
MKVRDVMEHHVVTVRPDDTYEDVAKLLNEHQVSGVPVVDAEGRLAGMVSEKDLYRILYPFYSSYYEHPVSYTDLEQREEKVDDVRAKKVEVFMTKDTISIEPDAPVMRAGGIMLAKRIARLPVVEDGKIIGLVSRSRIFKLVIKEQLGL